MTSFSVRLQAKESETVLLFPSVMRISKPVVSSREAIVRPNRLFTAHRQLVLYQAGHLKPEKVNEVIRKIVDLLER